MTRLIFFYVLTADIVYGLFDRDQENSAHLSHIFFWSFLPVSDFTAYRCFPGCCCSLNNLFKPLVLRPLVIIPLYFSLWKMRDITPVLPSPPLPFLVSAFYHPPPQCRLHWPMDYIILILKPRTKNSRQHMHRFETRKIFGRILGFPLFCDLWWVRLRTPVVYQ